MFWFSPHICLKHFLFYENFSEMWSKICISLLIKHSLLSHLMKLEFSRHICEKYSNIKFHENPSSGRRLGPCGRTARWTDMTKLRVAFRNFANVLKKLGFYFRAVTDTAVLRKRYYPWFILMHWYTGLFIKQICSSVKTHRYRKCVQLTSKPIGLKWIERGAAAARLLELSVRIPSGGMDICLLWVLCVVR
jgi:hypothetical protein